ncbi:MAG: TonB-dependent receptor, partial [Paludibacter sp.]
STLSGTVRADGESIIGATIVAIHQPSGAQYGTVTNADGRYNLTGLRAGGPYRIEYSYVGYAKEVYEGVQLSLGEIFNLNVILKETAVQIGEVSVVANRAPEFNSERNGAAINISSTQISRMPTVSRSINDLTRLTPQANGNQIGGGNYRQNYITVDGAAFNNAFGIGTNLPGNGSPVSIDALDQISVNITPFDIRQSGFIGASINAVTKSGTNQLKGSVYTYLQNEKYKGNKVGNVEFDRSPASYNMYGVSLGGPIIKNKLFFFLNYEKEKEEVPGPSRIAATTSKPADYNNNIARPTEDEMNMISKYLLDNYGYETGPYQNYSFESPAVRLTARLDWNISQNHKFNIRYSYHQSKSPSNPSASVSPFSSIYTGNRTAMDAMWFKNSGYFQERNFTTLSAELNSNLFNGKGLNTLRVTYSFQDEPRSTGANKDFPFVDILKDNKVFTSFGTELFSYGNLREVKTITITDDYNFTIGQNNFTAGVQYEHNNTKNGFMRFGTSFYVFNSWDDFVNGAKPKNYAVTFSNTPGYEQAFPSFEFQQFTAYIQDKITFSQKFNVTAGIRADLPTYSQPVAEHPIIASLDFGGKKYSTATLPKQSVLLSPRLGFNYDINGDRTLVLRGGSGIFTGRVPFVWIVGQVGDAGMIQTTQTYSGNDVPGSFNPDPRAYYPTTQPVVGTIVPQTFTVIDPDFKLPQSWKSSLALDAQLPFGVKGTLEGIYNKDINTAFFVNRGLKEGAYMKIPGYADHRYIYQQTTNLDKYYYLRNSAGDLVQSGGSGVSPIVLENRKGDYYYSITGKLEKTFDNGLYAMVAYTYSAAKNLVDGAGDQAASAWNGNANVNGANSAELSYASYVIPEKVIANLSYRFEYLKNFATTVSLFYDGGIQGRYSYVYSTNIARDGAGSNNLLYVPKDASEITFVNQTVK